jgi:hypothetical protein
VERRLLRPVDDIVRRCDDGGDIADHGGIVT